MLGAVVGTCYVRECAGIRAKLHRPGARAAPGPWQRAVNEDRAGAPSLWYACVYVCMHACMYVYVCMHDITYVCTHTGYTDLEPKIGKRTLEIHHDKVFSLCVFYM